MYDPGSPGYPLPLLLTIILVLREDCGNGARPVTTLSRPTPHTATTTATATTRTHGRRHHHHHPSTALCLPKCSSREGTDELSFLLPPSPMHNI